MLLLDTLVEGAYIPPASSDLCPPLVRQLHSSHLTHAPQSIAVLEAPNVVHSLAASVLTQVETHSRAKQAKQNSEAVRAALLARLVSRTHFLSSYFSSCRFSCSV